MVDTCNGQCQVESSNIESQKANDAYDFQGRFISEFNVPKMDCPSEERLIRLSLDGIKPRVGLIFDIPNRKVTVFHDDNLDEIGAKLKSLEFGATLTTTRESNHDEILTASETAKEVESQETKALKWLLLINATMFFIELVTGWYAQSTGLIADSLDMFADAAVYGLAIFAVGRSVKMKLRTAHLSGWLQVILALGALSEVLRRFMFGSEPASELMIGIGMVALVANISCLALIFNKKNGGAHMQASWIFSANDVIANLGVILAGILVAYTGSRLPDLIIGLIIGSIVLNGARRILRLKS